MQRFYRIQTMRPFDIWEKSVNDGKGNLTKIVFKYDLPTEDSIFQHVKYFFVTNSLSEDLIKDKISGIELKPVITTYADTYPGLKNQQPVWQLLITGLHGKDDFGLLTPTILIVSDRVVELLKKHGNKELTIHDYDPNYRNPIPSWMLDEENSSD